MRESLINTVDKLMLVSVILFVIIGFIMGYGMLSIVGGVLGAMLGFVAGALSSGVWFCLSGIYHNTKRVA